MKTATLLRALLLLLQLVLLSLLLAGPVAACIASLGSPVWWAIALAPVAILLGLRGARQTTRVPARASAGQRRRPAVRRISRPACQLS